MEVVTTILLGENEAYVYATGIGRVGGARWELSPMTGVQHHSRVNRCHLEFESPVELQVAMVNRQRVAKE